MKPSLDVRVEAESVWLSQVQIVELFDSSKANIREHLKHIFDSGELAKEATVRKFRTVRQEGNRNATRNIDMAEFPDDIEDELLDWEIDEVMRIREICDLPDAIDPPGTGEQIDWMVDFANRSSGTKFVRDIQYAIDSRHPFGAFKDVMAYYGLLNDWYQYRDTCYMDYVRRELGLE